MNQPPYKDNIGNSPVTKSWLTWFQNLVYSLNFITPVIRPDSGDADTNLGKLTPWPGDLTIQYKTTLTNNRTITLAIPQPGAIVRVVRPATGAFTLNVAGVKNLAAGQWCMLMSTGTAWIELSFGSL